ncbi:MAG: 30S ribosomal protein S20 [Rickettsiaceae bacterium]|nr:MAG: 30S ribosomal protein S20 [Rickettsiaceae bacterium]
MANHSSAKKAIRQTIKKTAINKNKHSRIKTYIKKVIQTIATGSKEEANIAFIRAQSEIMTGVTKKIFKLNTASRKVSRLALKIRNMA